MKLSPSVLNHVKTLVAALAAQDDARLLATMESIGAEGLFDAQALEAARALGHAPLVILLATLWTANEIGGAEVEAVLLAYQSFTEGRRLPALSGPIGAVMDAIVDGADFAAVASEADEIAEAALVALDLRRADVAHRAVAHVVALKPAPSVALKLFERVASRHDLLSDHIDWTAMAHIYRLLGRYLRKTETADACVFDLFAASAWQKAGDHRASTQAADCVTSGALFATARLVAAKSYGLAGQIEDAICELDRFLAAACDGDLEASLHAENPSSASLDPSLAARALADLQAQLKLVGVEPFLISGTLLGYARGGRTLSHDKDIDLGLFGWERQFDIAEAVRRDGLFTFDCRFLRGAKSWMLPLVHAPTGVAIDLFFYRREGDFCVTGVDSHWGFSQLFAFRAFDVEEVDFLGLKLKAPRDVDAYLTDAYGRWRTPEPAYVAMVESPAIVDAGGPEHMLGARIALAKAVEECRDDVMSRILDAMAAHAHRPLAMDADLGRRLRGRRRMAARACA